MKKLSLKQVKELLSLLNVQLADNLAATDDEAEKDFNPRAVVDQYLNAQEPVFMQRFNDNVLPDKLKELAGTIGGKLRAQIRQLSGGKLKTSDLEGLTDEQAIQKLYDITKELNSADAATLRTQIEQLTTTHNEEMQKLKDAHKNELKTLQNQFTEREIDEYLFGIVKAAPLPKVKAGEDETKAYQTRAAALKMALRAEYGDHWDPTKKALELRMKDKPENPVILDGNKVLTPKDFAENYFKNLGMWQEDTRGVDPNDAAQSYFQQGNGGQGGGAGAQGGGAGAGQQNNIFAGMPAMPGDVAAAAASFLQG